MPDIDLIWVLAIIISMLAITFAASTSFATPVNYQTNTMVYSPGGYSFTDFTRIGLSLNIIFFIILSIILNTIDMAILKCS